MKKKLVLVGGGHAHMTVMENISQFVEKNVHVTVIGPSDYHYYSGMGPGMLGGTYQPEEIRFATRKVVENQGGRFVRDRVTRVDPKERFLMTETGARIDYDLVSFNAGSHVPMQALRPAESGNDFHPVYPVKPIEKLMEAANRLKAMFHRQKIHVSIVGGGPSAAEVAGNVWQLARESGGHMPDITIFAGKRIMSRFPESVRSRIIRRMNQRGIELNENGYVAGIEPGCVALDTGETKKTDFTFMALGVRPSALFEESGLPVGPDKGLLVNTFLQSVVYPEIFGGGDCICFEPKSLDKVGVYAVRQNPVLLNNLIASLEGRPLERFDPGPEYLLIFNTGGGTGVLKKWGLVFGGTLAFKIKDYIDRKFMAKFQAIEKKMG